jgi:cytochrome c oxidase subunit 2
MDFLKLFNLPVNASSHGHEVDMIIYLVHILMIVLFVGWGVYFIVVLFKFRKKKNPKANYKGVTSHFTTWIEVGVVIIEAVLLLGFSIPFWAKQVNAFPKRTDVINVRIIAEQFAWNIHYPGRDGIFGKTNIEFFDKQSNPVGLDPNDPYGKDDITTINQLHFPIGKPAVIQLTSRDVMHSFSLPVMRVKQDVIPGMSIPTWFTPTKTGQFEIACAQLCGLGHYRMKGFLTIHTQEDYDAWVDEQSSSAAGGEEYDDFWN